MLITHEAKPEARQICPQTRYAAQLYELRIWAEETLNAVREARESVPDATTLLKFRRLLEEHKLTAQLFDGINAHLSERGLLLRKGTMVDATIIRAPPSTKNEAHARDAEMDQTKKGNAWSFGMKAHIGADADSGLVHSLHATAANESDVASTHALLHGQETHVFADAGYTGVAKRGEIIQAQANGTIRANVQWVIAQRRSTITKMAEGALKALVLVRLERGGCPRKEQRQGRKAVNRHWITRIVAHHEILSGFRTVNT